MMEVDFLAVGAKGAEGFYQPGFKHYLSFLRGSRETGAFSFSSRDFNNITRALRGFWEGEGLGSITFLKLHLVRPIK